MITSDPPVSRAPAITEVRLLRSSVPPAIQIIGSRFDDADAVEFDLGNDTTWLTRSAALVWTDTMVTVQVPAQVFLGQTDVYVVHPRHGRSNAARLAASGDLGFVALGDSVGVLDKHSTNNELVKEIRVDGSAMDVVTTSDNARAYVAVLDQSSSSGSSSLAVVDTLTLDIAKPTSPYPPGSAAGGSPLIRSTSSSTPQATVTRCW